MFGSHWNTKIGDTRTTTTGYILERVENHPLFPGAKDVLQHRLRMAEHLGRTLLKTEHVHHVDGNRKNNDIVNLRLVTSDQHSVEHYAENEPKRNWRGQFVKEML